MGFPSVPEQVQIGDIPVPQIVDDTVEEQVTERIQEQIGFERIEEQGGDFPAPIVDDTVEIHVTERIRKQILPERVEEQIGSIPVPQIVDDTVRSCDWKRTSDCSGWFGRRVYFSRARSSPSRIVRGDDPEVSRNPN